MNNLYDNVKLYRSAYAENELFPVVARTHGRGVPEEIIQQDEVRREVKLAVMKGDATCTYVFACSLYDTNTVQIISTVDNNVKWNTTKKKFYSKI